MILLKLEKITYFFSIFPTIFSMIFVNAGLVINAPIKAPIIATNANPYNLSIPGKLLENNTIGSITAITVPAATNTINKAVLILFISDIAAWSFLPITSSVITISESTPVPIAAISV